MHSFWLDSRNVCFQRSANKLREPRRPMRNQWQCKHFSDVPELQVHYRHTYSFRQSLAQQLVLDTVFRVYCVRFTASQGHIVPVIVQADSLALDKIMQSYQPSAYVRGWTGGHVPLHFEVEGTSCVLAPTFRGRHFCFYTRYSLEDWINFPWIYSVNSHETY